MLLLLSTSVFAEVVGNPFNDPQARKQYLSSIRIRGVAPEEIRLIPNEVLSHFSPSLFVKSKHFDELSADEQETTLKKYTEAIKFMAGKASARLKQVKFLNSHIEDLPFIHSPPEKGENLGNFLYRQLVESKSNPNDFSQTADSFNQPQYQKIEERIQESLANHRVPTLFVDLDDTAFHYPSRILKILQDYDKENKTRYFEGLNTSAFPWDHYKEFLYRHLTNQFSSYAALEAAVEEINEIVSENWHSRKYIEIDEPNEKFVAKLKEWQKNGAKIVFVTTRWAGHREPSIKALERVGLPTDELYLHEDKSISGPQHKVIHLENYLHQHPTAEGIAMFDDNRSNIKAIGDAFPEMLMMRAVTRPNPRKNTVELILIEDEKTILKIFDRLPNGCSVNLSRIAQ